MNARNLGIDNERVNTNPTLANGYVADLTEVIAYADATMRQTGKTNVQVAQNMGHMIKCASAYRAHLQDVATGKTACIMSQDDFDWVDSASVKVVRAKALHKGLNR